MALYIKELEDVISRESEVYYRQSTTSSLSYFANGESIVPASICIDHAIYV